MSVPPLAIGLALNFFQKRAERETLKPERALVSVGLGGGRWLKLIFFLFKIFLRWTISKVFIPSVTTLPPLLCFGFSAERHGGSQLPSQGWNTHPLHWKAKSQPLDRWGSPEANVKRRFGEFPGGLLVRIQCYDCRGLGSILGQGTKIPQATRHGQKKKQQKNFFFFKEDLALAKHFNYCHLA